MPTDKNNAKDNHQILVRFHKTVIILTDMRTRVYHRYSLDCSITEVFYSKDTYTEFTLTAKMIFIFNNFRKLILSERMKKFDLIRKND